MKPVQMIVLNIDKANRTAIVKSRKGKKFPVKITMPMWKLEDMELGDDGIIVKSSVNGDWLMIDYSIESISNYAYHNSMNLETGDLIYDENGELYE